MSRIHRGWEGRDTDSYLGRRFRWASDPDAAEALAGSKRRLNVRLFVMGANAFWASSGIDFAARPWWDCVAYVAKGARQYASLSVGAGDNIGVFSMCDYSLHDVQSRPAKVGDKLTTRQFDSLTTGFAAPEDANMAVCVSPGTEIAFATNVSSHPRWAFGWKTTINQTTAIFRQINKDKPHTHHDALEFADGQFVLLTDLVAGQEATVLQLPAEPASATEVRAQEPLALIS